MIMDITLSSSENTGIDISPNREMPDLEHANNNALLN